MTITTACERLDEDAVGAADDRRIREALVEAFASSPAAPVFRERRWWRRRPAWRWVVRDGTGGIAAHLAVHDLVLGSPAGDLASAGIAEVYVRPAHRGAGLVRAMLAACHAHACERGLPWSSLFGSPRVYGSSGYAPCGNPLRVGGDEPKPREGFQACPLRPGLVWPQGVIDLRGPEW